jgi:hypothetical protein
LPSPLKTRTVFSEKPGFTSIYLDLVNSWAYLGRWWISYRSNVISFKDPQYISLSVHSTTTSTSAGGCVYGSNWPLKPSANMPPPKSEK